MKKLLAALLLLTPCAVFAQQGQGGGNNLAALVGDPAAGKMYWESNLTACRNCHGALGEGAFGPDLAGRGLSTAQLLRAVRQPWGIMPRFINTQLSAQQAADLAAYFATLPKRDQPGAWRFEAKVGDPPGARRLINMGCAQCHTPVFQGPRNNMGAVNMSYDDFENLVYNHTTAIHQLRVLRGGNPNGNVDMGDYNRERLTPAVVRQIYLYLRDEMGFRPAMVGQLSKAEMGPTGATYTLQVRNAGLQGRGIVAEGLTVRLVLPQGTNVVAASGGGYQGTRMEDGDMVAVWNIARSSPGDQNTLSITLNRPGTQQDNLRGNIRWARPAPKTGPSPDVANIAAAPL